MPAWKTEAQMGADTLSVSPVTDLWQTLSDLRGTLLESQEYQDGRASQPTTPQSIDLLHLNSRNYLRFYVDGTIKGCAEGEHFQAQVISKDGQPNAQSLDIVFEGMNRLLQLSENSLENRDFLFKHLLGFVTKAKQTRNLQ